MVLFSLRLLLLHGSNWWSYFDACGIQPLTVAYEELIEVYETTVQRVLQYLQIPIPQDLVFAEWQTKRQVDELSEEWIEHYHPRKRERLEGILARGSNTKWNPVLNED